jgi:hypothetical protein
MSSQMPGEMPSQIHSQYPRGKPSQFLGEIRPEYPSEMLRE